MLTTKGYAFFFLLSAIPLVCSRTNTTFSWASAAHTLSTTSTDFRLGDFVAAGLGISHRETSSTLVSPENDGDHTQNELKSSVDATSAMPATTSRGVRTRPGEPDSRNNSQSSIFADSSAAGGANGIAVGLEGTTDITNITSTTDCWQSWSAYWSASSLNTVRYSTTGHSPDVEVRTELFTPLASITTKTLWSLYITDTMTVRDTISSDGYPVSVTTSYKTITSSKVGWDALTLYSELNAYNITKTYTFGYFDPTEIALATTALPMPRCEPPTIVPECSSKWSSYINGDRYSIMFYGTAGTPDCTQVSITGDWCTSMRSFYFAKETFNGQDRNIGWVTTNHSSYFPVSKSLAPGCSLGCQACSITGETVQLYYWPPATTAAVENGIETATLTHFVHNTSSPLTAVVDGTTLTSPTVYISYDVLHAADSCGAIGQTYRNTIVPLLNTDHLFSLTSVVQQRGYDVGFRTSSFNFTDLIEPIPDSIYNRQYRCKISSLQWLTEGHAHGNFSCARTAPYAPIIGVPPEARALDPAWASCGAWYGGLFDPPRALLPADAIAVPTLPAAPTSLAASPQPSVDSELPTRTSAPVTTSMDPKTAQDQGEVETAHLSSSTGLADPTNDPQSHEPGTKETAKNTVNELSQSVSMQATASSSNDASNGAAAILSIFVTQGGRTSEDAGDPLDTAPAFDHNAADPTHVSRTAEAGTSASDQGSVDPRPEQSAMAEASEVSQSAMSKTSARTPVNAADGVAAILSMFRTQSGADVGGTDGFQMVTATSNSASQVVEGTVITSGSGVNTARISVLLDGSSLSDGYFTIISGKTISAQPGVVAVNGAPQSSTVTQGLPAPEGTFTIVGQGHTAVQGVDGGVEIDGTSYSFGAVAAVDGSALTIAPEGVIFDSSTIPFAGSAAGDKQSTVVTVNGHSYTIDQRSGLPFINGLPAPTRTTIAIDGDVFTIGSDMINFQDTAVPLASTNVNIPTITAVANLRVGGQRMSGFKVGDGALIAGKEMTLGQVTTIAGTRISVASDGIVVGSSTAAFRDIEATADPAVLVGDTVYTVSTVLGQSDVMILAGQTISEGGSAVTVHGQAVTYGSNGISTIATTRSATATPATSRAQSVIVLDGVAYTATPISGNPGAVVLQSQTLSVNGPIAVIGDHSVTKGPDGISVAEPTSMALKSTFVSTSTAGITEGSGEQQSSTDASAEDSDGKRNRSLDTFLLWAGVMWVMLIIL